MENRFWSALFLVLGLVLFFSPLKSQPYGTLLYEISGGDCVKKSYLYGTFHIADERVFDFSRKVMPAFKRSKIFAMELIPEMDQMMGATSLIFMEDQTLKTLLSKEKFEALDEYFQKKMGIPVTPYLKMKPFFTQALITQQSFDKDYALPLDLHFLELAKKQKKKLIGLESMTEQMQVVDMIPLEEQAEMLYQALELENEPDEIDKFLKWYVEGQLDSLLLQSMDDEFSSEALQTALNDKRNITMTDRLIPLISKKPTFIAVGALHLPGEQGILSLLKTRGYLVKPIY